MKDFDLELLWKNSFDSETIFSWMGFYIDIMDYTPEECINVLDKEWDLYIAANEVKHPFDDWSINRECKERFMKSLKAKYSILEPQPEQTATEPQQMELKALLPKELKTDEAVKVFQKAIDTKLITNSPEGLKWNDTKQLLAYFATKVSEKFSLTTRLDKDGYKTTAWKPFETLFNKQGLKGAKQNWMRLNTKFEPTGFEKVDALF